MSSSCSSIDLGIDPDFDDLLTDSLLNDIELFAEHTNRLRQSLDLNTYVPDGESRCVQVHAALSMVSQSVRDLLVRYPIFKTSQVLIPASQLVHSVKDLNFDCTIIDSGRTIQCIEKLEAAVGNTLKNSVYSLSDSSSLDLCSDEDIDLDELPGYSPPSTPEEGFGWRTSGWKMSESRGFHWGSLSTIPEAPTPTTPVSRELSEKFNEMVNEGLSKTIYEEFNKEFFKESNMYFKKFDEERTKLEDQALDENGKGLNDSPPSKYNTATFGRKLNKQVTLGAPGTTRHAASAQPDIPNGVSTVTGASNLAHAIGAGKKNGRAPLLRRHSTFQQKSAQECEMDTLLMEVGGHDAMQIAFGRSKSWSRYCQLVISFYNQRLRLEHEHAQKLQKLVESTRNALSTELKNNTNLPMFDQFNTILDASEEFGTRTESVFKTMNEKVVKYLQQRHDDHESVRRTLKQDYAKNEKALNNCVADLKKAQRNMESSMSTYSKARDTATRSQHAVQTAGVLGPDHHRKMKEIEKKKKNEEDALLKKIEAENQVRQLFMKKEFMTQSLDDLKLQNIKELCSGIILCDRSTQVAASRFSEALSNLWLPLPGKYQELADAARQYRPGSEFMSFLQNLPGRSVSSSSLVRQETNGPATPSEDEHVATTSTGGRSSTNSSMSGRVRRNALNEAEHYDLIVETQQHRKPKRSMGRLFDQGLSSSVEYTEPTKSHKLVRTRQVIKCCQCDRVSLLSETVKCTVCGISWHKKCLPSNNVICGPSAKPFAESVRRVSIFGVPLKNYLEIQKRKVPQILEKCIDEIQKRGMKARGIYRTCGVKSKVEQICQMFEQSDGKSEISLDDVHPMNVASVIKLYFRKLPEPLLGYDLYHEFLGFDCNMDQSMIITRLQDLFVTKLPEQNYETLKFLMLHLKRVTWFKNSNLMPASNLSAVIAPSLIWAPIHIPLASTPISATGGHSGSFINDAHQQSKVIEFIIEYAFEIFDVDGKDEWKGFFEKYSGLKEPEQVESDQIDYAPEDIGLEGDEDDLEDDYDGEDEIEQTGCSSSNVSQQPPTPDLLRNTNNNTKNFESSVDDLQSDFGSYQRNYSPATRTVSVGNSPMNISTLQQQFHKNKDNDVIVKPRSFTTSILVSPQNTRKIFLPQQHSMDSRTKEYEEKQKESNSTNPQVLKSGEVTIDMKKDQYLVTSTDSSPQHHPRTPTRGDRPPPGPKNAQPSSLPEREQLCLNGLGLIFSTGSDVSYV